jgi:hypothetical protein
MKKSGEEILPPARNNLCPSHTLRNNQLFFFKPRFGLQSPYTCNKLVPECQKLDDTKNVRNMNGQAYLQTNTTAGKTTRCHTNMPPSTFQTNIASTSIHGHHHVNQ